MLGEHYFISFLSATAISNRKEQLFIASNHSKFGKIHPSLLIYCWNSLVVQLYIIFLLIADRTKKNFNLKETLYSCVCVDKKKKHIRR